MAFSPSEVHFLQRLIAVRPMRRSTSQIASWFSEHHSLGVEIGRHVEYQSRDFEVAASLLAVHGLPVQSLGEDAMRADAALYAGMSEKSQSRAPSADAVALKCLGSCRMGPWELAPPAGSYVVVTVEQACTIEADRLLVVENLETFRWIEHYRWIDTGDLRVLVLFRGARETTSLDVTKLLTRRTEPTWAFYDFDPAGLGMALALPRLERLILPTEAWLQNLAKGARSMELFDKSRSQYEVVLQQSTNPQIRSAWSLMSALRAGIPQERMRDAPAD